MMDCGIDFGSRHPGGGGCGISSMSSSSSLSEPSLLLSSLEVELSDDLVDCFLLVVSAIPGVSCFQDFHVTRSAVVLRYNTDSVAACRELG
jgi:hypothetical protein